MFKRLAAGLLALRGLSSVVPCRLESKGLPIESTQALPFLLLKGNNFIVNTQHNQ